MRVHAFNLDYREPVEVFASLADDPYSLFLDSAARSHPAARYSFIAFHPFETIEASDGKITVTNRDQQISLRGADPFTVVKDRLAVWGAVEAPRTDLPPFQGGAA